MPAILVYITYSFLIRLIYTHSKTYPIQISEFYNREIYMKSIKVTF